MATRKAALVQAIPLHEVPAPRLRELLDAERVAWLERLHWNSGEAADLTARAIGRGLLGGAALRQGGAYLAYLGLQPSRYVSRLCGAWVPEDLDAAQAAALVAEAMRCVPETSRVEGQVAAFDAQDALDHGFGASGLHVEPRAYLERALPMGLGPAPTFPPLRTEHLQPCARVLVEAHRGGVEARINTAFGGVRSATEYLADLLASHGCGEPVAGACLVAVRDGAVVGFCLGTTITTAVGHVPQIAVDPSAQGCGVGRDLLIAGLHALAASGHRSVTLSVSLANERAASWYARAGFRQLTRFSAYIRSRLVSP
jgi:ribosomal protein S18 acetylase RimI-like enzyme